MNYNSNKHLVIMNQSRKDHKNNEISLNKIHSISNDSKVPIKSSHFHEDNIKNLNLEITNLKNCNSNKNTINMNQNFNNNIEKDLLNHLNGNNNIEKLKESNIEIKYHKFFINDNKQNIIYKHKSNRINTTKYSFITFLPKALLFQFMRLANIYFLIIAIIQCIPVLSSLTPSTAITPIAFVLTVSLIREALEDYSRYKYDNYSNRENILAFRNDSWMEIRSGDLLIGELVIVQEDKSFPSDLILLDSNIKDGLCYIETATLDGEKTLKLKNAEKSTSGYFNNGGKWKNKFQLKGNCNIDKPSPELYKLNGKLEISFGDSVSKVVKFNLPLDAKQLLLKGAVLKNTKWIIGIVCYTGHFTKLMLNSKKPRIKFSRVESLMTNLLVVILIMQMFFCLLCSFLNSAFYNNYLKGNIFVDLLEKNILVDSIFKYFTYLLLLNTMIPISLIITLEIVKIIQGFFISFDIEMYSKVSNKFVNAKSVSLNEELGKVDYIFSDKTGTLTCNKMNFRFCVIGDVCYEVIKHLPRISKNNIDYNYNNDNSNYNNDNNYDNQKNLQDEIFRNENDIQIIGPNHLLNVKKSNMKIDKTTYENFYVRSESNEKVFHSLDTDYKLIEEYLKVLALNNDCVIIDKEKEHDYDYSGLSPDDIELVKAAKNLGCVLRKSDTNNEKVLFVAGSEKKYQILNSIEFTSERKKSSIIVKEDNKIKLYIKGADSMMYPILSKENKPEFIHQAERYVDLFSKQGYRTLLVGMRVLDEKEYTDWLEIYKIANLNLTKKAEKLEEAYELMESNIHLLGATIVEDKLQENVPETIRDLRLAKIKIWMLTGDKIDTAENIAKSCNLISEELKVFKIPSDYFQTFEKFIINFNDYLVKNQIDLENNEETKKNIIDYSIIVDFYYLFETFKDLNKKIAFVKIAKYARSVICSRCSPRQKAEIVKLMKEFDKELVTLAIGDGGNDVSMIMEAHIGIGVYGEEGMMAVKSSDYAIGEFQMLRRLLLYHGRTNNVRISEIILYFFYKNFVFTITHFYYAFFNNFSGQTIIDDWFISLYNMIFTALPLISKAIIDHDIKPEDGKLIDEMLPFVYGENKDNPIFRVGSFIIEIFRGMIHGLLNFFILYFIICKNPVDSQGNIADLWFFSVNCFTNIIFIVSFNLLILSKYITVINVGTMVILSWVLYFVFIFIVNYLPVFNSHATMQVAFRSCSLYLSFILIVGTTIIIDLGIYFYNHIFKGSLINVLMEEKYRLGFQKLKNKDDSINSKNNSENNNINNIQSRNINDRKYCLDNNGYSEYDLPHIIKTCLLEKQKFMIKNENSSIKLNKANERDLNRIDRISLKNISKDKLILSNNIQVSENNIQVSENNLNINEHFSEENQNEMNKTESYRITQRRSKSIDREKFKDENKDNNYEINFKEREKMNAPIDNIVIKYDKILDEEYKFKVEIKELTNQNFENNIINDGSIFASKNQSNNHDIEDNENSTNFVKININEGNCNFRSSRVLPINNINSNLNILNIGNKDILCERKKTK